MKAIVTVVFKAKQYVEGYVKVINKKQQAIDEHYNVIVDEVSDGRINQQTLWAGTDNEKLLKKLDSISMYQQVKLAVNVNFFEGKPSKIIVLDVLTDDSEVKAVDEIFKRIEQEQQELRQKKVQE